MTDTSAVPAPEARERLKSCPFCGGKGKIRTARVAEDAIETWAECLDCFARTDAFESAYAAIDAAAALWNRRHPRATGAAP